MSRGFIGFRRTLIGILGFFLALVILGVLKATNGFIQPVVVALLLSFILNPLVELLVKIRVPRFLAILIVILALLGISVLLGLIVYESVQSILAQYPKYQSRFVDLVNWVTETFQLPPNILSSFEIPRTIASVLVNISSGFIGFVGNVAMTMVFLLFIMGEKPYIKRKLREAVKHERTEQIARIFAQANRQVARYLIIKLFVSFLTGAVIYIGYSILGVDFAFIWGLLTFLFNFIPTIGSIVISVVAILFSAIQFLPDWNLVIIAAVIMVSAQMIIGNILDPKLTGDSLNLSPVVILLALLMWGWLWGTSGLFLAVPLTVGLKITFDSIPGLRYLGILMGTGTKPGPEDPPPGRSGDPEKDQEGSVES